jgi:membrane protein DedA with SNARE-associated domain
MAHKPDSPEAQEQTGEGYDGRYGCLAVAVVCLFLAIIPVASALIGKGFPTAIGNLELGALLVIAAVVLSVAAAVGFIIGKPKE